MVDPTLLPWSEIKALIEEEVAVAGAILIDEDNPIYIHRAQGGILLGRRLLNLPDLIKQRREELDGQHD